MSRFVIAAVAVAFVLSVRTDALALPPEASGDDGSVTAGVPQEAATRAGLTEAQQKEIAHLTAAANLELDALRKRHHAAQAALDALLKAPEPKEDAVLVQVEAIGAAETAIRKNRVQLMLRIRKVLGPARWASLQAELEGAHLAQQHPAKPTNDDDTARVGDPVQTEQTSGTLRGPPPKQH